MGGPDFVFLPWPHTSLIIGGISESSAYLYTLYRLLNLNKFSETEKYEQYLAEKSYRNDELGKSLGDCDIQQIRIKQYDYDMNYLLGLNGKITTDGYDFTPYYNNGEDGYWNGEEFFSPSGGLSEEDDIENRKLEETSVGSIFINDIEDLPLKNNTICEINVIESELESGALLDTSGNGNLGIIIGDYEINKTDKDLPSVRDSVMKKPKIIENPEDGAI